MKITLVSDDSLRLEATPGPMTVEAQSADQQYSPFHMLASGLAYCTYSILHSWAENKSLSPDGLTVDVAWQFAEKPHRVGAMQVSFAWPGLPADRVEAAKRVAALCTVHKTLEHPPAITIEVKQ
jgi:putative redox protein